MLLSARIGHILADEVRANDLPVRWTEPENVCCITQSPVSNLPCV